MKTEDRTKALIGLVVLVIILPVLYLGRDKWPVWLVLVPEAMLVIAYRHLRPLWKYFQGECQEGASS